MGYKERIARGFGEGWLNNVGLTRMVVSSPYLVCYCCYYYRPLLAASAAAAVEVEVVAVILVVILTHVLLMEVVVEVVGMVDTGIIHLPHTICTREITTVDLDLTIRMPMEGMVVGMDILPLCQVSFFGGVLFIFYFLFFLKRVRV